MYRIVVIFLLAFGASSIAFEMQNCAQRSASITEFTVTGCDKSARKCMLKKGTNPKVCVTFKALQAASQLEASALPGNSQSMTFGIPKDACSSGLECPLKADQTYKYSAEVDFSKTSVGESDSLVVQITKKKEGRGRGKSILCFNFPFEIVE